MMTLSILKPILHKILRNKNSHRSGCEFMLCTSRQAYNASVKEENSSPQRCESWNFDVKDEEKREKQKSRNSSETKIFSPSFPRELGPILSCSLANFTSLYSNPIIRIYHRSRATNRPKCNSDDLSRPK